MNQYKAGGKGSDRQFWLSAWSARTITIDRKSQDAPISLQSPFVGIFGGIPPEVLPDLGTDRQDGLLDRFVFAYPEPMHSGWSDAEISEKARKDYERLYSALRRRTLHEDDYGDPDPQMVELSYDALEVLKAHINEHRAEMVKPGFPSRLKGPWSKLEAYLPRIALVLAMARTAARGGERVEAEDVLKAELLFTYFKNMARRVYTGLYGENELDRLAHDLATFLEDRGGRFKDEPKVLYEQLQSKYKGPRPAELTKRLKEIVARTSHLEGEFDSNYKKNGQSRRYVAVVLKRET